MDNESTGTAAATKTRKLRHLMRLNSLSCFGKRKTKERENRRLVGEKKEKKRKKEKKKKTMGERRPGKGTRLFPLSPSPLNAQRSTRFPPLEVNAGCREAPVKSNALQLMQAFETFGGAAKRWQRERRNRFLALATSVIQTLLVSRSRWLFQRENSR